MKTAKEYRHIAKAALKGNWGTAIGVTVVYSLIVSAISATVIGAIVLTGALVCGYSYCMVNLCRNKEMKFSDLFEGLHKPKLGATIGYEIKSAIFIMLWSILFYIPGYIAFYRYSMAPYILMDNPEMTGIEAIRASKELMHGKKWKLFCVDFSFIGWILLCIITLGLGLLWIEPWMQATRAAFYEDIKGTLNTGSKPEDVFETVACVEI